MKYKLLRFPHKQLRACVIREYIRGRYDKVVCFSCGNAAKALEDAGVDTLHIGEMGVLEPHKWFTQAEIQKAFPTHFDATSGNLPVELMNKLAVTYRRYLTTTLDEYKQQLEDDVVYVPSGSGETLVCLKLAFPDKKFVAVYNLDKATEYSSECPLNGLVRALAFDVIGI